MDSVKRELAHRLLEIEAVKLQPHNPFTWASGLRSPIYCDNRKALSFPELRSYVKSRLSAVVAELFPEAKAIAGVATGAIAQGALVAEELRMPFVYVRSAHKDHGLGNLIEGCLPSGAPVAVVEDLVSTGGSSLKAVAALRSSGYEVVGMVASFTYGFASAQQAFADAGVRLVTLTDYDSVVSEAVAEGYINADDIEVLRLWRADPAGWVSSYVATCK